VTIALAQLDDCWTVVLLDDDVELERVALANGGFREHRALARILWRRLAPFATDNG
jgi:hypothetical protein